jgi:hypothetical protein
VGRERAIPAPVLCGMPPRAVIMLSVSFFLCVAATARQVRKDGVAAVPLGDIGGRLTLDLQNYESA